MDRMRIWISLGVRLLAASPRHFDKVCRSVERLVEGQKIIAAADPQLVLRARRPEKRYLA